jgi:hypothetical protein
MTGEPVQEARMATSTTPPTPTPTVGTPPPTRPPRRSFKSWLVGSLLGALLLIGLYTAFMLWWSYSEGDRAGVLQKFSTRGWVCKTHEGELAMYVVGGVAPQIWSFSARDPAVIEQLNAAVGKQVRLHYTEHRGLPTDCFGETDYFIRGVQVIGDPAFMRPAVPEAYGPLPPPPAGSPPPATAPPPAQ